MAIKNTLKRCIKIAVSLPLFFADTMARIVPGQHAARCVILYYHAITPAEVKKFIRQMDRFGSIVTPVAAVEDIPAGAKGRFGIVTFDDGYESVVKNALPVLRERKIPCTIFITTGSIGKKPLWVNDPGHAFYNEKVMDADEIKKLGSDGLVTIGSHGVNHSNSRNLTDEAFLQEIAESRRVLEDIAGHSITTFSFPHGKYLERHLAIAASAGYKRVFSIEPLLEKEPCTAFLLGRISINPEDWTIECFLKIAGAYRWQTWKCFGRKPGE